MKKKIGRAPVCQEHADILRVLCTGLNDNQRLSLVRYAEKEFIVCLCECALNILRGTVPLSSESETKLSKYAKILRFLANRGKTVSSKKKIICQRVAGGGFLTTLLTPILANVIDACYRRWNTRGK